MQLFNTMTSIVTLQKVAEMRIVGRHPTPVSLDEITQMVEMLKPIDKALDKL